MVMKIHPLSTVIYKNLCKGRRKKICWSFDLNNVPILVDSKGRSGFPKNPLFMGYDDMFYDSE